MARATGLICYVLGCPDRGTVGRMRSVHHVRFGYVCSCAGHDPGRYDAGRPIVDELPTATLPTLIERARVEDRPDDGPMAPSAEGMTDANHRR